AANDAVVIGVGLTGGDFAIMARGQPAATVVARRRPYVLTRRLRGLIVTSCPAIGPHAKIKKRNTLQFTRTACADGRGICVSERSGQSSDAAHDTRCSSRSAH